MTVPGQQAGWYPDPYDQGVERYWDGLGWTGSGRPAPDRAAAQDWAHGTGTNGWSGPTPPPRPSGPFWPATTVLAGAALVIASFLPWTTLTGTFGARASVAGTSPGGDGWMAVVLGLILATAGGASMRRPRRGATVVVDLGALCSVALMCYEIGHLTSGSGVLGPSNAVGIWDVGIGVGLATAAVASVISLLGAAGITGRDARSARAIGHDDADGRRRALG